MPLTNLKATSVSTHSPAADTLRRIEHLVLGLLLATILILFILGAWLDGLASRLDTANVRGASSLAEGSFGGFDVWGTEHLLAETRTIDQQSLAVAARSVDQAADRAREASGGLALLGLLFVLARDEARPRSRTRIPPG